MSAPLSAATRRGRPAAGGLTPGAALAPALLVALTLTLLLAGAAVARPGTELAAGDRGAGRALVRFYGVEQNATDTYRWSEPLAGVFLYGFEGRPAVVTLRLAAPRPPGEPAAVTRARSGGVALGAFGVAGDWRRYQILAPTSLAGESALLLETAAFTPEGDPRELGVALSAVRVAPAGPGGLQPVRALYLLALPLLGWLALLRLGAPGRAALAVGLALAGLAGLAAALPTAAGYWLPSLGWPLWPAAPLLLLALWPRLGPPIAAGGAWAHDRPAAGWAGLALGLAALVAIRLGLPWPLGMAGLAVGVWAALGLAAPAAPGARAAPTATDRAALAALGIVAAALLLRLANLGGQPAGLWRDESRHGLQALRIWSDPSYRPIYVVEGADLPALIFYLMAPVVGLLGPEAWSARLVSAVAGALTPLALAWAAWPLLGRRAALLAAALAAWASWLLSMSRWAFPATLDHLLVLTAVGLVWRCVAPEPHPAPGAGAPRAARLWPLAGMALAGLLGGLAVYAYHTGRVAPLALAAVAAIRLGPSPAAWRRAAPGLAAAALVGALVIAPLAFYILSDLDGYNRRVGSVSILDSNDPLVHSPAGLLLGNLGRYALAYHVAGDANGRHHMPGAPLLDPLAGLLMALGLGLALAGARRSPGLAAVLALGAVYLIPGVFSGNAPHAMRSLGTLAPALMLAGAALAGLAAGARAPGRGRAGAAGLIAATLAASLAFNTWLYFGAMRLEPTVYGEFDLLETTMGRVARAPAQAADPALRAVAVFLPERLRGEDTVQFLTWGVPVGAYTGAPLPGDGPALVLLPASATPAEQAAALAALGPGAAPLGPTATYPGGDAPIAIAFGRGEAATRLLAAVTGR